MTKRRRRPRHQPPRAVRPAVALQPASAAYTTTLVAESLPPCPFCGATVAADVSTGAVIHGLPICDRFRRLPADDFLTAMRQALEGN